MWSHSGTLMNGDPLVCGGLDIETTGDCFHFQRDTKKWKQVRVLNIVIRISNYVSLLLDK